MQPLVLLQEVLGGEALVANVTLPLLAGIPGRGRLGRVQLRLGLGRGRNGTGQLFRRRRNTWRCRVNYGTFDNLLLLLLLLQLLLQLLLLVCDVDELG